MEIPRELRASLLAAIAEMDLKGTNSRVTQAMCIIEEVFDSTARGHQVDPRQAFLSGTARAGLVDLK